MDSLEKFYNEYKTEFILPNDYKGDIPHNLFENNTTLKLIDFGYNFNENIDNLIFPNSVEIIKFGYHFTQSVNKVNFPINLHTIIFNSPLIVPLNNLPNTIKRLEFFKIDVPLDNLPISLEEIIINDVKICAYFSASKIKKLPFNCKIYWLSRNYHYRKELCIDKLTEITPDYIFL